MNLTRRAVLQMTGAAAALVAGGSTLRTATAATPAATKVDIVGNAFHLNGNPTYPGRIYLGAKIEGLLFNSRMANCIVDDHNPSTRGTWAYPDGPWDPERNVREFIAALPEYKAYGLNSIAFNVQGGSPTGYA